MELRTERTGVNEVCESRVRPIEGEGDLLRPETKERRSCLNLFVKRSLNRSRPAMSEQT